MFRNLVFAAAGMAAASIILAPQTNAQPDLTSRAWEYTYAYGPIVCQFVDANPTVIGFANTLDSVALDGFSAYESSGILIAALSTYCPRNYWLVDAFLDAFSPPAALPSLV